MGKLIDVEELLAYIEELPDRSEKEIESEWNFIVAGKQQWVQCPRCCKRAFYSESEHKYIMTAYCPHCGLKLRR